MKTTQSFPTHPRKLFIYLFFSSDAARIPLRLQQGERLLRVARPQPLFSGPIGLELGPRPCPVPGLRLAAEEGQDQPGGHQGRPVTEERR
jgi:hypothetical protein